MAYRLVLAVLALGALVTLGFMLYAGSWERPYWWLALLVFYGWTLVPYLFCGVVAHRMQGAPAALRLMALAAALLSGASGFLLHQSFIARPDAQGALVFVFLPLWQLVALLPFALAAGALRSRLGGTPSP